MKRRQFLKSFAFTGAAGLILWAVHNWFGARRILELLEFDKTHVWARRVPRLLGSGVALVGSLLGPTIFQKWIHEGSLEQFAKYHMSRMPASTGAGSEMSIRVLGLISLIR